MINWQGQSIFHLSLLSVIQPWNFPDNVHQCGGWPRRLLESMARQCGGRSHLILGYSPLVGFPGWRHLNSDARNRPLFWALLANGIRSRPNGMPTDRKDTPWATRLEHRRLRWCIRLPKSGYGWRDIGAWPDRPWSIDWRSKAHNRLPSTTARSTCGARGDVDTWMLRERPQAAFVAAAMLGGILGNDTRPAGFLYDAPDGMRDNPPDPACQGFMTCRASPNRRQRPPARRRHDDGKHPPSTDA